MQRQRSSVGSMPETLDFDHGATSGNSILEQQLCWNRVLDSSENRLSEFSLSHSHLSNTLASSSNQAQQNDGWIFGGPSTSGTKDEVSCDEQIPLLGWSSSGSGCAAPSAKFEERQFGRTGVLSLDRSNTNSEIVESSNSNAVPMNLNLNVSSQGYEDSHVTEGPDGQKHYIVDIERIPPANDFNSASDGNLVEVNDGSSVCSLDCRHHSCKRKAVEVDTEPYAVGGSPSSHANYGAGSSMSIPASLEAEDQRLRLDMSGLGRQLVTDSLAARRGEISRRNLRLRINPLNLDSPPPPTFTMPHAVRHSGVSASPLSLRPVAADHALDFRLSPAIDGPNHQTLPNMIPARSLEDIWPPVRLDGSCSSSGGGPSSSITMSERDGAGSGSSAGNLWEYPMLVPAPEPRRSIRLPPIRIVSGRLTTAPGNVASSSQTSSGSGLNTHSDPPLEPHMNLPFRNSRRVADYVRHSLQAVSDSETPGQSSSPLPHSGSPGFSEETAQPTGASSSGLRRANSRLPSWLQRHVDGVLGIPHTLRAGEGRSRIVSEIRNVLDLMRRGEGLRIEDVMLLDQSVPYGVADIHDRHRDMRLDVDNMSYEELLALEERIGNVNTGLREESIINHLKQKKFSVSVVADAENEPCCICREEYNAGEDLGILDCGHDFHTDCIKQWLMLKNLCPICKTTGLAKCEGNSNNSGPS